MSIIMIDGGEPLTRHDIELNRYQVWNVLHRLKSRDSSFSWKTLRDGAQNSTAEDKKDFAIEDFARIKFNDKQDRAEIVFVSEWNAKEYAKKTEREKSALKNKFNGFKKTFLAAAINVPRSNRVFIVHGQDHVDRDYVAGMLLEWKLKPIILDNNTLPGSSMILESLEKIVHSVDFGIVIETPDEFCGRPVQNAGDSKNSFWVHVWKKLTKLFLTDAYYNVRPNVNIELGMLIGCLGRRNLVRLRRQCVLFALPSDLNGMFYKEYPRIDDEETMRSLWQALRDRGYYVKEFDFVGCNKDAIIDKYEKWKKSAPSRAK